MTTQAKQQNTSILSKLNLIKTVRGQYLDLAKKMMEAGGGNIFPVDLLMRGIIQRSISTTDSIVILFENKKYLTVMELLRNHLETLLTIYAIFQTDKPHELAINILRGKKRVKNYKDRNGQHMTYSRLMKEFVNDSNNKEFNFKKDTYDKLSSFTHISDRHMKYGILSTDDENSSITFSIGDFDISHGEQNEMLDLAITITRAQFKYIIGWIATKNL